MPSRPSLITVILLAALSACTDQISSRIEKMSMTPLAAPVKGLPIGMVYRTTRDSGGNVVGALAICDPGLILGGSTPLEGVYYQPRQTTETQSLEQDSIKNNIVLDASKLKIVNASISNQAQRLRQVYLTISNARINDGNLSSHNELARLLASRKPDCKRNIEADPKHAEAIMKEFVATIVYKVVTQSGENFSTDVNWRNAAAAQLGVQWDDSSSTFTSGENLVYGYYLYPVDLTPLPNAAQVPSKSTETSRPSS